LRHHRWRHDRWRHHPHLVPGATAPTPATPETNLYYGSNDGSNPDGYLSGAAEVTNADAQYQLTIQEASRAREEARQAAIETRRMLADEARYERNNLPTEQELRDGDRARALDRARKDPPLTDILSGRALNDLYRHLAGEQDESRPSPDVRLREDVVKKINLAPRGSRANAGLLKDGGKLRWPLPLQGKEYQDARTSLQRAIEGAVRQVKSNKPVEPGTLKDMNASLRRLDRTLRDNVPELSPSEYIGALRYLGQVGNAVTALSDTQVATYCNQDWVREGKDVGGLVRYMAENGLEFAPAVPGDEAAYAALYHALAAFDARLQQAQE
jgi:hypothetical protein